MHLEYAASLWSSPLFTSVHRQATDSSRLTPATRRSSLFTSVHRQATDTSRFTPATTAPTFVSMN